MQPVKAQKKCDAAHPKESLGTGGRHLRLKKSTARLNAPQVNILSNITVF